MADLQGKTLPSLLGPREVGQAERDPDGVAGAADDDLSLAFFHAGGQGDDSSQAGTTRDSPLPPNR